MRGFIWMGFLVFFVFCLYFWSQFLIGAPTAREAFYPWLAITLVVASFFILFSIAAFPKIRIDKDSIVLKSGFTRTFFALDEVKIEAGGWVLRLGGWTMGDWCVPFRRKECIDTLEKVVGLYVPKAPRKVSPRFLLYFLPVPILFLFKQFLKYLGVTLNPTVSALLWGVVATFSLAMTTYKSPVEIRIGKLNKAGSSLLFGLFCGIIIFVFMMLATS